MEGDANNRSDVYTSCTNNVGENTHGHTFGVCWILLHATVQSGHGQDWWIGSKPLYSLKTSIQQFQLVEFPY